jgi:hypothetical protein
MTDILRNADIRPSFKLITPMSSEFDIYGGPATVERARTWALKGRYLLVAGVLPACAHGMYLMNMCPTYPAGGVLRVLRPHVAVGAGQEPR